MSVGEGCQMTHAGIPHMTSYCSGVAPVPGDEPVRVGGWGVSGVEPVVPSTPSGRKKGEWGPREMDLKGLRSGDEGVEG